LSQSSMRCRSVSMYSRETHVALQSDTDVDTAGVLSMQPLSKMWTPWLSTGYVKENFASVESGL